MSDAYELTDPPPRQCGACTACCEFPEILELDKPEGVLCRHACEGGGCSIYAERPSACREYECLWLEGELDPGDRPDLIGLAFDRPAMLAEHADYAGIQFICARETRPGARDERRARELLTLLARGMVVRLSGVGVKTQLLGPRSLIETLAARAAARKGG